MIDGRHDFDFIFGRWAIRNRKLADPGDPACTEWVEFDATAHAEPILGGLGHVDRMWTAAFEGFTLRQYDPAARVWRIWWASSRRPGHLDPAMEGAWSAGRGTFHCDDIVDGRPVRVRFVWTHEGADRARWEQAFSFDAGATWQVNWTMDLTRQD